MLLLVAAGIGAGLTGTVAGLASLVSYPVLLALGLTPLAANVSNTLGLLTYGPGSALGARRELRGQGRRALKLAGWAGLGGAVGSALLLIGGSDSFERIVPWLIAFGSLLLLMGERLRVWTERRRAAGKVPAPHRRVSLREAVPVVLVGIYGGYFGAASGIMMLAVLALEAAEPLAVTNAVKNVANSVANVVAAVVFAIAAPVNWPAAGGIAAGVLVGSWIGAGVVRVLPERPLRIAIALAGLGLAVALYFGWIA